MSAVPPSCLGCLASTSPPGPDVLHIQVLDDVRVDLAGQAQPGRPPPGPLTRRFTRLGVILHRPGAAPGAVTGVEIADVMARAQAHRGGHEQLPQAADRDRYQAPAAAQPPAPPASFVPMNVSGAGLCTAGR